MVVAQRWLWVISLGALAAGVLGGGLANAEESEPAPSFSLKPVIYNPDTPHGASYFILDAWPGETIETEVMVINTGDTDGVAELYAVDATTGQTSGVVYHQKHVEAEHVGTWVALNSTGIQLAAGEQRIVTFTIAVPDDARPGHHVGGLVVVPRISSESAPVASNEDEGARVEVHLETRMAVGVQVTVPGAKVAEMQITGLEPGGSSGYQKLNIGLENTGNVMLKPRGELTVRNDAGVVIQDIDFQLDTFLPATAIEYAVYMENEALDVGTYEASVSLSYGDGQEATYSQAFSLEDEDIAEVFAGREPLAPPAGIGEIGLPAGGSSMTQVALMGLAVVLAGMLGVVGGRSLLRRGGAQVLAAQPSATKRYRWGRGYFRGQRSGPS